jgi:hypothetical protein
MIGQEPSWERKGSKKIYTRRRHMREKKEERRGGTHVRLCREKERH